VKPFSEPSFAKETFTAAGVAGATGPTGSSAFAVLKQKKPATTAKLQKCLARYIIQYSKFNVAIQYPPIMVGFVQVERHSLDAVWQITKHKRSI
jgi:hypothetical protein